MTIKILVADDHPVFRQGLISVLREYPEFHILGQASNGEEALAATLKLSPDVVLMDIHMPKVSGVEATAAIMHQRPQSKVLILTVSEEEEDLFAAIKAGAKGYMLKNTGLDDLLNAIRAVASGEAMISPSMAVSLVEQFKQGHENKADEEEPLTPREKEVLGLTAEGHSNREIAEQLFISETTVKAHLSSILEKLHARNRAQAVALAVAKGLLE